MVITVESDPIIDFSLQRVSRRVIMQFYKFGYMERYDFCHH